MTGRITSLLIGAAIASAHLTGSASVIVLDFEGIQGNTPIGDYYNGIGGPSYGVSFSSAARSLIDADAGGTGNFANEPSPDTVMYLSLDNAILTMVSGFTDGFSFYYSAHSEASVSAYSGIDATGNLLTTALLGKSDQDCTGDPTGLNCSWTLIEMNFPGIARSIAFRGVPNGAAFDDITLGTATSGSGNGTVAEPVSLALFGLGLVGVAATYRGRRPT